MNRLGAWMLFAGAAAPALAQPSMVIMGLGGTDLSPDGATVLGSYYDAASQKGRLAKFNIVSGLSEVSVPDLAGIARFSTDLQTVLYTGYNLENFNNSTNSITYGTPTQYQTTGLACTWRSGIGRSNLGVSPTGNRCDYTINAPYDISGDGRWVVGGQWTNGLCGAFRAFVVDSISRSFTQLPISYEGAPAFTFASATRANCVNNNGTVVAGYDQNYPPQGGGVQVRRPAVWVKNGSTWTLTVLERAGGEIFVMNDAGDIVGGKDSLGQLCRWIRQGTTTTWIKEVIPGGNGVIPMAMSASGNAMVGDVFIWTPEINEGNVLNLNDHLFNLGANWLGEYRIYNPLGPAVWDISDDATKILVRGSDDRSLCLNTFSSALIDLTGSTACVPAQMILDPVSDTAVAPAPGYYTYGVILNCMAGGTWPLNYQWQKENESGEWVDLYDDVYCNSTYAGASFDVKAPTTSQLRLGFLSGTWRGRYRCVVSNACGQVISDVARVGSCPADYNFDGGVDGDDVISYFADWDAANPDADFTGDGGVDGDDVIVFFSRWDQSC